MEFDNEKDFSSEIIDNLAIENEDWVKTGENLSLRNSKILDKKAEKSICQILKYLGYGSGFFCKIKYPDKFNQIICLITNNHVITRQMLLNKEYIEIKLNEKLIKISLDHYRNIWTSEALDFTCIEIIKSDNILEIIDPFELDESCYNMDFNVEEYNKRGIVNGGLGEKEEIELPQGIIFYLKNKNDFFFHNCNTKEGTSGGPIILIRNLNIVGMHRGYEKVYKINVGIYFHEIIKNLTKENLIYKNLIKCTLDIELKEIEEGIIILNSNKYNREEINNNIIILLNNNKINFIYENDKFIIDKKNFTINGKYELKIIFYKTINNLNGIFENCSNIYSIDLSNFDTTNIVDISCMFNGCKNLKKIKGIDKFNIKQVRNMTAIFKDCNELLELDLSNFDTSNAIEMESMFAECNKLKDIKGINKFNTSQVINMRAMFQNCNELILLNLSSFNTSKVIDMEYMFNGCYKLQEIIGVNRFNTSQVTNMRTMFQNCNELKQLDLSNFDTSQVTTMEGIFNGCNKLKEIKGINKFNTSQVTNMGAMFQNCNELRELDLSNFNTSKVNNMGWMFCECNKLKEIKGINKFNTSQVINMRTMFQNCKELKELDLSHFNTSKVEDMGWMFFGCKNLEYLNLLNFTLKKDCITKNIFMSSSSNCYFITNNKELNSIYNSCFIY